MVPEGSSPVSGSVDGSSPPSSGTVGVFGSVGVSGSGVGSGVGSGSTGSTDGAAASLLAVRTEL